MQIVDSKLLLTSIDTVFNNSDDVFADDHLIDSLEEHLSVISSYFGITNRESFMFSIIFILSFSDIKVCFADISGFFKTHPTNVLFFKKELETLCKKRILRKSCRLADNELFGVNYAVNQKIVVDLLDNKPFNSSIPNDQDIYAMLERVSNMVENSYEYLNDTEVMHDVVTEILESNRHIPFIDKILEFNLKPDHYLIFLYVFWTAIAKSSQTDASLLMYSIYRNPAERVRILQSLYDGTNELFKRDLLELGESMFLSDGQLKVTENTINLAKSCSIAFNVDSKNIKNLIKPTSIKSKRLIFNESEIKQLHTLKELLKHNCYEDLSKSLIEKNLPEGVTAIFYGNPGTGKTESVLQIARDTERDIMKVDLSQTKSMWYGESEKQVRKIFADYKNIVKQADRVPILLINEADGLISKRGDVSLSNAKQTENTIQSILLEELETFKGILIATTNNTDNFDKAFDRRFLFKINFPDPDYEIRAKIWKDKRPELSENECYRLSSEYHHSGAQIDNIVRKLTIEETVHGKILTFAQLTEICSNESFNRRGPNAKIGFLK